MSTAQKKNGEDYKQLDTKILFLEKLMIEKDNNIYALQKKHKELVSQVHRLKE